MSHLSVVDHQLEEGVHQQDAIRQDAAAVQQNRLKTFKLEKTSAAGNMRRGARLSANDADRQMEGMRLTSGGPWKEYE